MVKHVSSAKLCYFIFDLPFLCVSWPVNISNDLIIKDKNTDKHCHLVCGLVIFLSI